MKLMFRLIPEVTEDEFFKEKKCRRNNFEHL
jgi:hypothetical protein